MTKEETRKNLIRFDAMPKEKHLELSRKGGIKSGESRAERKALKEELDILLSNGDMQQRVCTALLEKCMQGSERAFAILRDSLGEKSPESLELIGGASLEKYREEHREEIIDLVQYELENQTEKGGKMFGQLAHTLASKQMKNIALRRYMESKNIIDASSEEKPNEK